jgi:hydroxymethylbilane synthase
LQTRLRKLDEGQCDAMVLAAAGLHRLDLADRIAQYFEPEQCTPAVGQGALGIECHKENELAVNILKAINDPAVWACTRAERAFLNRLGGGCSVPVGAHATLNTNGQIELSACVASLDGKRVYTGKKSGTISDAASLGNSLADQLIKQGAGAIVEDLLKTNTGAVSPP